MRFWTIRVLPAFAMMLSLMLLAAACSFGGDRSAGEAGGAAVKTTRASQTAEQGGSTSGSANVAVSGSAAGYSPAAVYDQAGADGSNAMAFPAAQAGGDRPYGPGTGTAAGAERKLIYNASVTMEVEDYGAAQTELFNMIPLAGGYLLSFSDTQTRYEIGGNFVIKVPSQGFQSFLANLEKLAMKPEEVQRSIWGQDVTEEYVDLTSRLKAKQVVEERLLTFMEKASNTESLLQFSNELARVQEEIETIKGRMRYLDQNVAFSTVELRMYQRIGEKEQGKKHGVIFRAGQAMKDSGLAIVALFEGLMVLLAGALPFLLVLAVLLFPVWLLIRKRGFGRSGNEKSGAHAAKIDTRTTKVAQPALKDAGAEIGESGDTGETGKAPAAGGSGGKKGSGGASGTDDGAK